MKRLILILIFFTVSTLYAGNNIGTSSGDFLKIIPSARYKGLAESVVGIVNESTALIYNPAGLVGVKNKEVWLSHLEYLADFKYEYISYGQQFSFGRMGLNISYFSVSPFSDTDLSGNIIGELNANNLMISLGYARNFILSLKSDFSAGGGIKFINSTLHTYSAKGIAFDFGLLYETSFLKFSEQTEEQNFKVGFSMQNIGTKLNYVNEKFSLPLKCRLGVGYNAYKWKEHSFLIGIESDYDIDTELSVSTGIEYNYLNYLFIRTGYIINNALNSFSFGIGGSYKLKGMRYFLDFAFVPYSVLKNVYIVSLGAKF